MMHLTGRLIFVKPKKVGGSTLEFLLSSVCDSGDVLTPLSIHEDCQRYQRDYQLPVNVFESTSDEHAYHHVIKSLCENINEIGLANSKGNQPELWKKAQLLKKHARVKNHASLRDIQAFVGNEAFWTTPLVSICRHPYELVVSQASWNFRKGDFTSFDEALDAVVSKPHLNLRRYGLHRRWRGKRTPFTLILRLEELDDGLRHLAALTRREIRAEVPRLKSGVRFDERPADAILTYTQKQAMERHNRPLFDLWDNPPSL